MIRLSAPGSQRLRRRYISQLAKDIVQAVLYAPVKSMEHASWPYSTHSCVLASDGVCPRCRKDDRTVLVTVTEAGLDGASVRLILSSTYPHRCGEWSVEALHAYEDVLDKEPVLLSRYSDHPYMSGQTTWTARQLNDQIDEALDKARKEPNPKKEKP